MKIPKVLFSTLNELGEFGMCLAEIRSLKHRACITLRKTGIVSFHQYMQQGLVLVELKQKFRPPQFLLEP